MKPPIDKEPLNITILAKKHKSVILELRPPALGETKSWKNRKLNKFRRTPIVKKKYKNFLFHKIEKCFKIKERFTKKSSLHTSMTMMSVTSQSQP